MGELIAASLAFPTVIFTGLLGLAVFYWIFVILGVLEIEMFDSIFEGAAEGVAEGMVESAAEGAGEVANQGGFFFGLLDNSVPVTLVMTILLFWSWSLSLLLNNYLGALIPGPSWVTGGLIGVAAVGVSIPITKRIVSPLRALFKTGTARSRKELVGLTCNISTGSVDERFGQAELTTEDGERLLIEVRGQVGVPLKKGDSALVIDFDEERQAYEVEPL